MPVLMLRSNKYSCPECNKENKEDTIMLFFVDGDGRKYFFCAKCLGEFKVENETVIQTKKMEKEKVPGPLASTQPVFIIDSEEIKSESEINIEQKMENDANLPEPETAENDIVTESEIQIDK